MKRHILLLFITIYLPAFCNASHFISLNKVNWDSHQDSSGKLKFVILCFNLSQTNSQEISDLNNLAREYAKYVSTIVIKDVDLNKYKELFTAKEFKSLQEFMLNKTQYQKQVTSFPVILILDENGTVKHAWSGDKTEDGLKKGDFYIKIKAGLEAISNER
jgi:hypothetical protein